MNEKEKEKPIEVSLKQEDRELLKSVIDAAKPKPEPEHKHEHLTADSVKKFYDAQECPDGTCGTEEKKLSDHYVKEFLKDRKNLDYECEECGTPVKEDEEECPTCGSKNARRR